MSRFVAASLARSGMSGSGGGMRFGFNAAQSMT
jgi:hypothetical protein